MLRNVFRCMGTMIQYSNQKIWPDLGQKMVNFSQFRFTYPLIEGGRYTDRKWLDNAISAFHSHFGHNLTTFFLVIFPLKRKCMQFQDFFRVRETQGHLSCKFAEIPFFFPNWRKRPILVRNFREKNSKVLNLLFGQFWPKNEFSPKCSEMSLDAWGP